jgi:hypothetical protein
MEGIDRRVVDSFKAISRLENPDGFMTQEERYDFEIRRYFDGVKQFKRKLLGICGNRSEKSSNELISLIQDLGLASSQVESENFLDDILDIDLFYSGPVHPFETSDRGIRVERMVDRRGAIRYRVSKFGRCLTYVEMDNYC